MDLKNHLNVEEAAEPETLPEVAVVEQAPVKPLGDGLDWYEDDIWKACVVSVNGSKRREVTVCGSVYEHCADDARGRWIYSKS